MIKKKKSDLIANIVFGGIITAFFGLMLALTISSSYADNHRTRCWCYWKNTAIWNEKWVLVNSQNGEILGSVKKDGALWNGSLDSKISVFTQDELTVRVLDGSWEEGTFATFEDAKNNLEIKRAIEEQR